MFCVEYFHGGGGGGGRTITYVQEFCYGTCGSIIGRNIMFCVEYFHGISTHSEISCMFHVPISTIPIVSWNLEWEWDRQSFERKLECDTHTPH